MVTVLAVLGVLLVLFLAAVLATRGDVAMADAPPDAADLPLPDRRLRADDVRGVRFGLTLRGYRMSEVDAVLERVAAELAERDAGDAPSEIPGEVQADAAPVAAPARSADDGA